MLSGQFAEARGEVRFPEIPGINIIYYHYSHVFNVNIRNSIRTSNSVFILQSEIYQ